MSPIKKLSRLLVVVLVVFPLAFNVQGCSYIPWFGDEEDDLSFEDDFPFEDEESGQSKGSGQSEDDFFADDSGFSEDAGASSSDSFASLDQGSGGGALKGDVESLQSQQEALISKVRELEETINTLEPRIDATQEQLAGGMSSSSVAEFLEPEVEELKMQVARLNDEIARMKTVKSTRGGSSRRSSARRASFSGTTPEYDKALAAHRRGNYDESILLFQNLALNNPPSSLEDNIVFWIGNNYVGLEMYDDALKQFQMVIDKYPRGNKVGDSRYMMGVTLYKKGETSQAIDVLEAALKKNPTSEVRGKILDQLNRIQ